MTAIFCMAGRYQDCKLVSNLAGSQFTIPTRMTKQARSDQAIIFGNVDRIIQQMNDYMNGEPDISLVVHTKYTWMTLNTAAVRQTDAI